MLNEEATKIEKIFSRLSKECNIFLSREYKLLITFFRTKKSHVFYGRSEIPFNALGLEGEIRFLKLQFDFIRKLIEENLLCYKDYNIVLDDLLQRYLLIGIVDPETQKRWRKVACQSGKAQFVDFFFNKYENRFTEINISLKHKIIQGLPKL